MFKVKLLRNFTFVMDSRAKHQMLQIIQEHYFPLLKWKVFFIPALYNFNMLPSFLMLLFATSASMCFLPNTKNNFWVKVFLALTSLSLSPSLPFYLYLYQVDDVKYGLTEKIVRNIHHKHPP